MRKTMSSLRTRTKIPMSKAPKDEAADSASGAWWIHCDIDGSGARWRLAVDRGGEIYFPMEDFGEEMTIEEYRSAFPKNEMAPVDRHAAEEHPWDGAGKDITGCD